MRDWKTEIAAIVIAGGALAPAARAQTSPEDLRQALAEARQAAERAQNAAAAAEAALAKVEAAQAQVQAQAQAGAMPAAPGGIVPPSGLYFAGNVDLGVRSTSTSDRTKRKTELALNNASTSLIWFKGNRQLGPDLSASFLLELDFDPTRSSTANGAASNNAFQGTPFAGEQYLALTGTFGDIKLGSPNAGALIAAVNAQPYGTALGGGFSGTFGRLGTTSLSGINQFDGNAVGRIVRHEKTIMYTTPTWRGLKASAEYAFGNDNSATPAGNSNRYQGLTLYYTHGPAKFVYAYSNEKAGERPAAGPATVLGVVGAPALPAHSNVSWNILAGNYTIGPATIYGGFTTTQHHADVPLENSRSWNVALKYALSAKVALLANHVVRKSRRADIPDATMLGLGLNYSFDDDTNLYFRHEGSRIDALGRTASQRQDIYALGVQYRF